MWKKVIFFLAWVGMFVLSVLGIGYIVMPSYFSQIDTTSLIFKFTALNICLAYFIISLMKLFSNFARKEGYSIKNQDGVIYISPDSVRNIVKELLIHDPDINGIKIESGKRRGKFIVSVALDISSNINIAEKTSSIQSRIKQELQNKLDLNVDSVEVKISRVSVKREPTV